MENKDAKEILIRYQNGTASEAEKTLVEEWILFGEFPETILTEKEIANDLAQIDSRLPLYKSQKIISLWKKITVAAVVLLVASLSFYSYKVFFATQDFDQVALENKILPGDNKAYLTLSDGTKINLSEVNNGNLAQQGGIKVSKTSNGQLLYEFTDPAKRETGFNTITTPNGGQYQIILPDGTKVWLNAASSLKFPMSFATMNDRRVELKGEGYFEVTKDKTHPFRVINEEQEVTVLGTHFNINSYKDQGAIRTTLLEGSVIVKASNGIKAEVKIKPGEQAILTEKGINVVEKDVEAVIDWKNGDFIFQKEALREIMNRISRWYNVNVVYDRDVNTALTFSGQMSRSKNIKELLNNLESTGEIKFEISGSEIKVKNNE